MKKTDPVAQAPKAPPKPRTASVNSNATMNKGVASELPPTPQVAKAVVPAKEKPSAKETTAPVSIEVAKKKKKAKVVRDSFTMPETDYTKIADLKKKCLSAGVSIKKSELLRAGLHALEALPIAKLKALLGNLENVKTGRPAAEGDGEADPKQPAKKSST